MDSQPTIFVPPPGKQNGRSSSPTPNNERWIPVPPQPKRRRVWLWLLLFLGFGFFAVLLLLGSIAFFYTSDWILPGTTVLGRSIGGLTQAEATAVLQGDWQHRSIILSDGRTPYDYFPNDLGMTLDAAATASLAYQQGRTAASLGQLLRGSLDVPPVWSYEPAQAEALLNTLAEELYTPPTNAGIMLVGNEFIATPPFDGAVLDVAATLAPINQNPALVLVNGGVRLVMQAIPPAVADTALVEAKIRELRVTAVSLHAFDPISNERRDFALDPATWSQWVSLGTDNNNQLVWQVDEAALAGYLDGQLGQLSNGRFVVMDEVQTAVRHALTNPAATVTARIYHPATEHIVQPGETLSSIGYDYGIPYPWIQQANPTLGDALSVGQPLTIPSPDDLIPYPVVENKRIVVSISQQRVWAYENDELKWEWAGSTGISSSPTSPGVFQIQTHEVEAYAGNWNLYMPYFMGIYQPVPTVDFMNGFHGFPTRDGYNLLWTGDLGHTVTYGCILVSTDNAAQLYEWADQGVIVEVRR